QGPGPTSRNRVVFAAPLRAVPRVPEGDAGQLDPGAHVQLPEDLPEVEVDRVTGGCPGRPTADRRAPPGREDRAVRSSSAARSCSGSQNRVSRTPAGGTAT